MFGWDSTTVAQPERRDAPREEVSYRTRATAAGRGGVPFHIVNISASGFMARTDDPLSPGDSVSVRLPVVGEMKAEVRWALGGRIGCQFTRMIGLAPYLELLGVLMKDAR